MAASFARCDRDGITRSYRYNPGTYVGFTNKKSDALQLCALLDRLGIEAQFRSNRECAGYTTYVIHVKHMVDCWDAREIHRGFKIATEKLRGDPKLFAKGFIFGLRVLMKKPRAKALAGVRTDKVLLRGATAA